MAETEYQRIPRAYEEMMSLINALDTPLEGNIFRDISGQLWNLWKKTMIDSGYTDVQVEMAKGAFKDLASRLDASDQRVDSNTTQLAEKINNSSNVITMDHLSQAVKTAMTGGSVAVVGEGAVGMINLNADLKAIITDWQALMTDENEGWAV